MDFEVEVILRFFVKAESREFAEAIVSDQMADLDDFASLPDYHIFEWEGPNVKSP